MIELPTGTLLIVSGSCAGESSRPAGELAHALGARLNQPVILCLADGPGEPVAAGLRHLVAAGAQRLVMAPLVLSPEQDQGEIPLAIKWASRRWPFLTFHAAAPLSWPEWAAWVEATAVDALSGLAVRPVDAVLVLASAGSEAPQTNAKLAGLAHLVRETTPFARVEHMFLNRVRPSVAEVAQMLAHLDLRRLVVVPWLLAKEDTLGRLADQVQQAAEQHHLHAIVAATPLAHPRLVDILVAHHQTALADNSFLAPSWTEIRAEIARNLGPATHAPDQSITAEEEAQLRELDRKINELLQPEYQGQYADVRPESMGTASLQFGPDGRVAWDKIWTSFCDLALAGGPPHRGTLLEAVPAADALAEREKYQAVVAEMERGIRLVTDLPVVPSKTPGWVGIRCASEEMAIWLMRAIIVENVMARREGDTLYLPAGPGFTLQREIKNVVTVVAKTCHYWTAHIRGRRRAIGSESSLSRVGDLP
jgi:sirohydrochlorin cobaltochelatase